MKFTPITLLVLLFFGAVFFHFLNVYYPVAITPSIITQTLTTNQSNKSLDSLIGGHQGFNASWNTNDIDKDTLNFTILYSGRQKSLTISYKAKNLKDGGWQLLSSDTLDTSEE